MPPQVGKAETRPVIQQAPAQDINKDESKPTTSGGTTAAKVQSPETASKQEQLKHEPVHAEASARAAQGSKQNATEHIGQRNTQEQMMKKNLIKQVPNRESESIYADMKNAANLVAVKLPAAVRSAGEAAAEKGEAFSARQKEVEHLSKRAYPQDMVKGQMFEVEEIRPSTTNKVSTQKHTEYMTAAAKGDLMKGTDHPKQYREATQDGLKERLSELNNNGPLTEFENNLVLRFRKGKPDDLRADGSVDPNAEAVIRAGGTIGKLTPIKGAGNEVEAYKIQRGIVETYYDRNGNVLKGSRPIPEKPLEEGLAPWEVIGIAQAGKHLLTKGATKIGEKVLTREAATTITKAETGAVLRSAEKQIASETEKAGVKTYNTSWRQGSGTSVHVKPKGPAPKPPASEFTEAELKMINKLQDEGALKREAEDIVRNTRGAENTVEVVPTTAEGTTRKRW